MEKIKKKLSFASENYLNLMDILKQAGVESRLVGGCVRDAILGAKSTDIDICAAASPEEISKILSEKGVKVLPTGIEFGTVTAFLGGEAFEITSLRKDISCDGRRAVVSFSKDFGEDASRRDFTINALSYDPFDETIYDYFGGLEDLREEKVVFIGEPVQRIKEDFLRILRFFRFSSYYAKGLDSKGKKACEELKDGLEKLSKERIKQEMDRILKSKKVSYTLSEMLELGVLELLLPIERNSPARLERQRRLAEKFKSSLSSESKYSILFSSKKELKVEDLIKLKFSKKESDKIVGFISFVRDFENPKKSSIALKKNWLENQDFKEYLTVAVSLGKLKEEEAESFIEEYSSRERPEFPLKGDDLLKIGVTGRLVGEILGRVRDFWMEKDFEPEAEDLKEEVYRLLRKKPSSSFLSR